MKRFICFGVSAVTAILTFVFLSIPCFSYSLTNKISTSYTGWEMLSNESFVKIFSNIDGYNVFKIFTIVSIILAVLVLFIAIIILLQQLNVIKSKMNFCLLNSILLTLFTITSLVAMIGTIVMGNKVSISNSKYNVDMGIIFMFVVGLISTIASFICSFNNKAKKKK